MTTPIADIKKLWFTGKSAINSLSAVLRLLLWSRPTAVLFAVMSLVVLALNRGPMQSVFGDMLKVRWVHVVLELLKRLPQAFYPTTSIVWEALHFIIARPIEDVTESAIKGCLTHTMRALSICRNFCTIAATRAGVAILKVYSVSYDFIATVACAFPHAFTPSIATITCFDHESAKPFSDQFERLHYGTIHLLKQCATSVV